MLRNRGIYFQKQLQSKIFLTILMMLVLLISLVLTCCNINHTDSTDCCKFHDGVAMCYRPTGASHGHIMCKDGFVCAEECY